ncbi:hypothetical protein TRFO_17938 [Tritrichomonas foetus]|uniref:Peroxin-7 n=1 Tax=Tritrichomonas foetus TaxID=1144522 RepID=A0A1J4KM99_9EUKA|nr:hypothetical protein TRFO_17938 [Tritrichomonas foetus]|eukprot:OHT12266.1 hypothetical protein TRFO_17938 [Tritrichomonas foetus]
MNNSRSLWRQKGVHYFGDTEEKFYTYNKVDHNHNVKIALDVNYPLSFYVRNDGKCSLYTFNQAFKHLGTASLPSSATASQSSLIGTPNSIAHYNNWLLIATNEGVHQYHVNCNDVVRGQNIDDFVQLNLLRRTQPVGRQFVASFISADVQISTWPNVVHSVNETMKLNRDSNKEIISTVERTLVETRTNFEATYTGFYNHETQDPPKIMPLSGPLNKGVRQISFSFRANSYQSICGAQWFDWDIPKQSLRNVGSGDGFQLLSIDTSALLRETFAVGTYGGNVLLHDNRCKETIQQMKFSEPHPISNVKFSPIVQPLLATSTDDFKIKLWDLRSGFDGAYLTLEGHTHEISGIQFSVHRADLLYTSSYDSTIKIWNINDQLPPHHCMTTISPSPGSPVTTLVAGCHRPDSFYYSCIDGSTGICRLKEELFEEVIPHRLTDPEDREAERLQYFRNNYQLLKLTLKKVKRIIDARTNVEPVFPLIDLSSQSVFDLSVNKPSLAQTPLKEVIAFFSYNLSNAIPQQFMQAPDPLQLSDAYRNKLFAKVIGSIQKNDAETLMLEKRSILTTLEAFPRYDILAITQVLAASFFDEALEIGSNYLDLLIRNKKLDKFLDIGYFLLFPTIYDDENKDFQLLSQVEHNVRTQLRTMLNNGTKILDEIRDYQAVLATASNDKDTSTRRLFDTLRKHDRFLSMFLCRTYLSITLSLGQWSACIITASQAAKDTNGFPFHDTLFNWLDTEVRQKFSEAILEKVQAKRTDPATFINAIAEVILIATHAQELPKDFEDSVNNLTEVIHGILKNILTNEDTVKMFNASPLSIALAIKQIIDKNGRSTSHQGSRTKNLNKVMTLITNVVSSAPTQ